ncbi:MULTISPECIES: phage head-tail connector protein [Staphylococcus]|uniref:phage head-tail connector protein n=1 Tax=Staphylococcus TaxID=1279 RepID=UPI001401C96A|nr:MULTISPECIES: phage head-tail connector protein [Staphylococcus]NHM91328.1 phage head-tail adapter protein [Staphylococcus sp. 10602379]NJI14345.1 phage head-tail adapter protein [Staphylococcus agnetis]QIN24512.1 phage head-tail adapter protein [Staphylococcus agnetis]
MDALDVKMLNGTRIDDVSNDYVINKLILAYKQVAEEYCNQMFADPLPGGVQKFIAECIKYGASGNIASRSMGTVSYTYVTDVPSSMYKYLKPYRKLRW